MTQKVDNVVAEQAKVNDATWETAWANLDMAKSLVDSLKSEKDGDVVWLREEAWKTKEDII